MSWLAPWSHETHRVEGCLHRPRSSVDIALLMSANHLGTFGNLQLVGNAQRSFLDLDLRGRAERSRFSALPSGSDRSTSPYRVGTFGLAVRLVM